MEETATYIWATGRRKTSVARVRLRKGTGKIIINKKELDNYFHKIQDKNFVLSALKSTNNQDKYDVLVNVNGGGETGQSGAILLGLARALKLADPPCEEKLRELGLLTRDSRMVERKKYGHRKARASFQFSKR